MKYINFIAALVMLLFSCRKKEPHDRGYYIEDIGALHCADGVMNADEEGIDCGGTCTPCDQIKAPCQLDTNTLHISDGWNYETKHVISTSVDTLQDGLIEFKANVNNSNNTGVLTFKLESPINLSKTYYGTDDIDYGYGYGSDLIEILYEEAGWADRDGNGKVYIYKEDDGRLTIQSCKYKFYPYYLHDSTNVQRFSISFDYY